MQVIAARKFGLEARSDLDPSVVDKMLYTVLMRRAMVGLMRDVLAEAEVAGLPQNCTLLFEVDTRHPGVSMAQYLKDKYPSIFTTRWDVLFHTFMVNGNGLEWVNGELVDPYPSRHQTEEDARARFFDSVDALWKDRVHDEEDQARYDLERARRQFQLDHLDVLASEPRIAANRRVDTDYLRIGFYEGGSAAFTAPVDELEPSWREAILETLRECGAALFPFKSDPRVGVIYESLQKRIIEVENLTPEQKARQDEVIGRVLATLRKTAT